jgi:tRNA A-37 threonylcarbamoyl transferase component Bud32/tetratricopeptide (TPR) repeat protein
MGGCLDENTILELIEGALDAARAAEVAAHIDACSACRGLVARAAGGETPALGGAPLRRGTTLGRHVILEAIGAGAMGAVYAAYDPELERKVAIKLLRADGTDATQLRARLLREAQALARLQHPNVITVHDVGSVGDLVYLAMELVDGETLAAWLERRPRRDEVLEKLRQAGEGLAAAHAAGLVHRDFKPDNVLVGNDGRVRVTDFGLARSEAGATALGPSSPMVSAIAGTPAYMAPEVRAGEPATAQSDQYSFCVTLHEAVTGVRPPKRGAAPAWLRRIVERGLAPSPEARFPSLRALLDALAAAPRRRRRALAGATTLLVGALVFVAARRLPTTPRCDLGAAAWGDVWGERERATVQAAFARVSSDAQPLFTTVDRTLRGYRDDWIAMRDEACRATRVRGDQSEAVLDLRVACLDRKRRAVATLTRLYADADAEAAAHAGTALGQLVPVEECADTAALMARVPPPRAAAQRAAVDALDAQLDEVHTRLDLNHAQRALDLVRSLDGRVTAVGYRPLEARYLGALGRTLYRTGPLDDSEETLNRAAVAAEAVRDDGLLADNWTLLARLVGFRRGRPADGKKWLAYSGAAIERLGGDDRRESSRLEVAALLVWNTQPDEARSLILRARALTERSCKRDCWRVTAYDAMLANLLLDTGHPEEAIPIYRRVRAQLEPVLGREANEWTLTNEASALALAGHPEEALPLYHQLIDMKKRGGQLVDDGFIHHRVADALRRLGRVDEALVEDRRALELGERFYHADDPTQMLALLGIGRDLMLLGRAQEARAPLERALQIGEAHRQSDELVDFQLALAQALWDGGGDRARAHALAVKARDAARPLAPRSAAAKAQLDEILRWIAAH